MVGGAGRDEREGKVEDVGLEGEGGAASEAAVVVVVAAAAEPSSPPPTPIAAAEAEMGARTGRGMNLESKGVVCP